MRINRSQQRFRLRAPSNRYSFRTEFNTRMEILRVLSARLARCTTVNRQVAAPKLSGQDRGESFVYSRSRDICELPLRWETIRTWKSRNSEHELLAKFRVARSLRLLRCALTTYKIPAELLRITPARHQHSNARQLKAHPYVTEISAEKPARRTRPYARRQRILSRGNEPNARNYGTRFSRSLPGRAPPFEGEVGVWTSRPIIEITPVRRPDQLHRNVMGDRLLVASSPSKRDS